MCVNVSVVKSISTACLWVFESIKIKAYLHSVTVWVDNIIAAPQQSHWKRNCSDSLIVTSPARLLGSSLDVFLFFFFSVTNFMENCKKRGWKSRYNKIIWKGAAGDLGEGAHIPVTLRHRQVCLEYRCCLSSLFGKRPLVCLPKDICCGESKASV